MFTKSLSEEPLRNFSVGNATLSNEIYTNRFLSRNAFWKMSEGRWVMSVATRRLVGSCCSHQGRGDASGTTPVGMELQGFEVLEGRLMTELPSGSQCLHALPGF